MKTIILANQKGGSRKSNVRAHLAAAGDWLNQRKKIESRYARYARIPFSDLPTTLRDLDHVDLCCAK
jgi:hypothetical protein